MRHVSFPPSSIVSHLYDLYKKNNLTFNLFVAMFHILPWFVAYVCDYLCYFRHIVHNRSLHELRPDGGGAESSTSPILDQTRCRHALFP